MDVKKEDRRKDFLLFPSLGGSSGGVGSLLVGMLMVPELEGLQG